MAICSWCRAEYEWSGVYHVCDDGTTFADRIMKTRAQIQVEHDRRDGIKRVAPVQSAAIMRRDNLPQQSNTKAWFAWNTDDLKLAAAMKIKL